MVGRFADVVLELAFDGRRAVLALGGSVEDEHLDDEIGIDYHLPVVGEVDAGP